MVSDHVRNTLEHRSSNDLLELRRQGALSDEVTAVLDEILRARGVDPATTPVTPTTRAQFVTGDPLVVARRVRTIAWFQIAVAALTLWAGVVTDIQSWLVGAMFALVAGVNAAAGTLTLRGHRTGYWLSVWNHVAQIPMLAVPGFFFHYAGLGGFLVLVTSAPGVFFQVRMEPGIFLHIGDVAQPYFVGVDLLAIGIVGLLLSALRLQDGSKPRP